MTGDLLGDKTGDKRAQQPSPDGTQVGRQEKDNTREADTAPQTTDKSIARPETSWETRERQAGRQDRRQEQDKTREADTASQTGDKLGDKTRDKRNTRPGRPTQHLSQDGRQDRRQELDETKEADAASQTGDKLRDKTRDKRKTRPGRPDAAPQPRWETRPETRARQD